MVCGIARSCIARAEVEPLCDCVYKELVEAQGVLTACTRWLHRKVHKKLHRRLHYKLHEKLQEKLYAAQEAAQQCVAQ